MDSLNNYLLVSAILFFIRIVWRNHTAKWCGCIDGSGIDPQLCQY